jgi:hypothetical protein
LLSSIDTSRGLLDSVASLTVSIQAPTARRCLPLFPHLSLTPPNLVTVSEPVRPSHARPVLPVELADPPRCPTVPPTSQMSSAGSTPCRFFAQGRCQFATECRNAHGNIPTKGNPNPAGASFRCVAFAFSSPSPPTLSLLPHSTARTASSSILRRNDRATSSRRMGRVRRNRT